MTYAILYCEIKSKERVMNQMTLTLKRWLIKNAILNQPKLPFPLKVAKADPKFVTPSLADQILFSYLTQYVVK